jgi:3-dehydroquinate dehydratase-2
MPPNSIRRPVNTFVLAIRAGGSDVKKRVLMLHGINHNMFGHRDPDLYGTVTYERINEDLKQLAEELGVELEIFQTNYEGAFVEKIHEAFYNKTDAVLINPGGWTNYHPGVRDAVAILKAPIIEIHMSNIFKKHGGTVSTMTTQYAAGTVIGMGARAYTLALRAAVEMIEEKNA